MYAMVTVRAASTRLPEKCFLDLGYNKMRPITVLEHVIERCRAFDLIPIVSTTVADTAIQNMCRVLRVACYMGPTDDKLQRWLETCEKFNVNRFVTVDCDDPLFDPALTIAAYKTRHDVVRPDLNAYLGSMGWAMSLRALKRICKAKTTTSTEMIWKHFPLGLDEAQADARPDWFERKIRLTLDYEEDLWLIKTVIRELGPLAERQQIISFFRDNSGLTTLNLFRNEEWKLNQQNG